MIFNPMPLKSLYQSIADELSQVEKLVKVSLNKTRYGSIRQINDYLLHSPGKMIRPALLILSAKASSSGQPKVDSLQLINIASAMELIHVASLVHDDIIDRAALRHNRPTVNAKWGDDISIAFGDYLYVVAFELISGVGNCGILGCISSAAKAMCEGELIQLVERDNLSLLRQRYISIIKKKTAALFAASCRTGAMLSSSAQSLQDALFAYGFNFGIAFQILDDYLDLIGEQDKLGKAPGQDLAMGEATLPLLDLMGSLNQQERQELKSLFASKQGNFLKDIKAKLNKSKAAQHTKATVLSYLNLAKEKLGILPASKYRKSLFGLADYILKRSFP